MKHLVLRTNLYLLLALVMGWSDAGIWGDAMKYTAFAIERPPIDRAIPAKLEMATFAMG